MSSPAAASIDDIRDYWNRHIHDLEITKHPVGTPGFFADLDQYHFEKLHHLLRLIDFDGYRGRQVLEVGCGAGTDLVRFARGGAIVSGVDLSSSAVALATRNFEQQGLKADLREAYPFGMLAIPRDLYESAAIDGASAWRQFWSVTFPMLRPTFLFVSIVSIVGGLQLFTEPTIFTYGYTVRGGDAREVQTLTMYMFENSMVSFNFSGYGAAVSWSLFLLIILASVGNFLLIRRSSK